MSVCDICESKEIIRCEHCQKENKVKDYLETFLQDTSITMHSSGDCDCYCCDEFGYHSSTAVHKPTGISSDVTTIIREYQLIVDCPVDLSLNGLKEKLKSHYQKKDSEESLEKIIERRDNSSEWFNELLKKIDDRREKRIADDEKESEKIHPICEKLNHGKDYICSFCSKKVVEDSANFMKNLFEEEEKKEYGIPHIHNLWRYYVKDKVTENIRVGSVVKVNNGRESFWVNVETIHFDYITGNISNNLFVTEEYNFGDKIGFNLYNICDIKEIEEDVRKESKKPIHPGEVAKNLLLLEGFTLFSFKNCEVYTNVLNIKKVSNCLKVSENEIIELMNEKSKIDYLWAYKLAKAIEGTDVRFWMDLQEHYDSYKGEGK